MRKLLVWLCATIIRVIGATLRVTEDDGANILRRPDHPPLIYAFWHNRVGLIPYFYERDGSGRPLFVFISLSRDGQFITEVAESFGVKAVRGSTSRKGTKAALEAVRAARDPHSDIAITPDGPRGPRYQIQPGLLRLAQATGRPVVAVTYHLKWKWELKSWDRFQVPLPFSPCTLVTRGPITVPTDATDADLDVISAEVAKVLGCN